MTKEHRKLLAKKYIPITIMTIIAVLMLTSALPVFAVNTCPIGHCRAEAHYTIANRNGVEGTAVVSNPSVPNTQLFIASPMWMVFPDTSWIEIGWIKGESNCLGLTTTVKFYWFNAIPNPVTCGFLGDATAGTWHTYKMEDTNQDNGWKIYLDGVLKQTVLASYSSGQPRSGLESESSDNGTTGTVQAEFKDLKYYIGSTSYFWNGITLIRSPNDSNNPYYIASCADHPNYHWQEKKGSVPSC